MNNIKCVERSFCFGRANPSSVEYEPDDIFADWKVIFRLVNSNKFECEITSIDCWEDPFSKKRYSRIMGGKVIVTLNCQYEFVLTDPDFEFEQLKNRSNME